MSVFGPSGSRRRAGWRLAASAAAILLFGWFVLSILIAPTRSPGDWTLLGLATLLMILNVRQAAHMIERLRT